MTARLALVGTLLVTSLSCDESAHSVDAGAASVEVAAATASPLDALRTRAERQGSATAWTEYADALASAGRREEAVKAYELCSLAAADDFESALYCQAAAAVARSVKPKGAADAG